MSHASFVALAWKMYSLPPDGLTGLTLFRHVLGAAMIALQLWTAMSIYESLGEFGWFCGDFFFDPPSKSLTYNGIYRFLNNPERVLGLAGVWGIAVITWSPAVFYLATTAHILNLAFLQFVEKPHVIKVSYEHPLYSWVCCVSIGASGSRSLLEQFSNVAFETFFSG